MPLLVLGPLLRYVGETEATIWVETDEPCEVSVLGRSERTFHVEGHNYALLYLKDLDRGSTIPYEVHLDGELRWPEPSDEHFPPSVIRTPEADTPHRMIWGSCRVSVPHEPPYSLKKDDCAEGREIDAAYAYALRMIEQDPSEWPHVMLWLGDQVYADEVSPATRDFIRTRRDPGAGPPGEEVADFEEYTHLYLDSWSDPTIRWLLSTVSSAMIFDDHDVHDDWNTSIEWVREQRKKHWWTERIVGGFMSYWLYQHLGNLSPRDLDEEELWQKIRRCHLPEDDAGPMLRDFAFRADREVDGTRWSYCRDIGNTRIIVMDSRAGRVLDGRRRMVDDDEFEWIADHATGEFNHLVLATTLPVLLPPALHYMEAWDEAIAEGAWGKGRWARFGEKLRQDLDLEHWSAFQNSFHRVIGLVREIATGERGKPPGSIVFLSGDIHNAYLAELAFPRGTGAQSPVWQGVCSPIRNPLAKRERLMMKVVASKPVEAVTRLLAKRAGVKDVDAHWRLVTDQTFDNQVSTLDWEGRRAHLKLEKSIPGDPRHPRLALSFDRRLA